MLDKTKYVCYNSTMEDKEMTMIEIKEVENFLDAMWYTYMNDDRSSHLHILSALLGYLDLRDESRCRLARTVIVYIVSLKETTPVEYRILGKHIIKIIEETEAAYAF